MRAPTAVAPALGWTCGGPSAGVRATPPVARRGAVDITDVRGQVLEATAPNFLQLPALRSAGGFAVVIHRNVQVLPEPLAERMRKVDTDAHRKVGKRHEWG